MSGAPDGRVMEDRLTDYKDVNVRIVEFYEKYPNGRLTKYADDEIVTIGDRVFVKYQAAAYRTADDPHPGVGTAWEPFPGRTPYTRDSELMNAETAAWGRAIVACGIIAKNEAIASRQEVRNRQEESPPPGPSHPMGQARPGPTMGQQIAMLCKELGIERSHLIKAVTGKEHGKDLTREEAGGVLDVARSMRDGRASLEHVEGEWAVRALDLAHPSQWSVLDGDPP